MILHFAFAPVSGAYYTDTNYSDCQPSRSPLPILELHGYADKIIKYNGGSGNGGPFALDPKLALVVGSMR